jgi:hypothetical protein
MKKGCILNGIQEVGGSTPPGSTTFNQTNFNQTSGSAGVSGLTFC